MRILQVHNFYQQAGGEDQCFASNRAMLTGRGHQVMSFALHNDAVARIGALATAARSFWNAEVYRDLRWLIRQARPDVVHFENVFPLVSPAAYYAAHAERVPVVQTLHNFRITCPSAILYRDGAVCEECLGRRFALPGVRRGCYRGSRAGSAVVAAVMAAHRLIGTWSRAVDAYIVLNRFALEKFVAAGLPADRLHVSPNFLPAKLEPGPGDGGFALFAGRLTPEKGVTTLLEAWKGVSANLRLKILGEGPESERVRAAAAADPRIDWLGWRPQSEVVDLMGRATCLVLPSLWYEGFNRTIVEAFARATPVVASDLGSMRAIVEHGRTGLRFRPGDPGALAATLDALAINPGHRAAMAAAARREFETHYTEDANHDRLLAIYRSAGSRLQGWAAA
ncbi:glycosyl transferase family 1 [Azospirillum sp. TSH7]|uniref:glycosyltransferase n=1 Tax=unclassified Azospirillum TaxID=2630922 RepID=UPI000D603BBE|nr:MULTISPECIES: glycosyltransferase [unclassified Azospirillum]PWC62800.1 glycosyl transferase family 1 [Azospirillum sp. TSH20]PWC65192.1 glycosyl transferase family 1 [Azospirillum sp. TSH7]